MKALGIVLIASSTGAVFFHFLNEFFSVDMCLDAGNVYDYAKSQCRSDVTSLPYIPYLKNFSWFVGGSLLILFLGIACTVLSKKGSVESAL
ncbi:MAG: hypothetical protein COA90_10020 [Gammaproteobacteria bacterium]|nr:MAG: hypothetical protein COA90_10020 [Gammaproteobacteria bacterium]